MFTVAFLCFLALGSIEGSGNNLGRVISRRTSMCVDLLSPRGDIPMHSLVHNNRFAENESDNVLCDSAGIFFHDVR
jgi:hypothetical protein